MPNQITKSGLWLECRDRFARWTAKLEEKIDDDKQHGNSWNESFWKFFEPLDTCCLATFCPWVVCAKTYHRLEHKGDMKEYEPCNMQCIACYIGTVNCPHFAVFVLCGQIDRIRKVGDIKGNMLQDFLKALCCTCSIIQNEKESQRLFEDVNGADGVVDQQPTNGAGRGMSMSNGERQPTNNPQNTSEAAPAYSQQPESPGPNEGQTNGVADPTVAPKSAESPTMAPAVTERTSDSQYTDCTDDTISGGGIPTPVAQDQGEHTNGLFMDKSRFMSSESVMDQDTSDTSDDTVEATVTPTPATRSPREEHHVDDPVMRKYTSAESVLLDQGTLESSTTDYSDTTSEETVTPKQVGHDQVAARDSQRAHKHTSVESVVLDQGTLESGEESW